MVSPQLSVLCDLATEAHTRAQQLYQEFEPIVGVSQNMRENGIPADVMTIDCRANGKRILLILHDQQADTVHYQFCSVDDDPSRKFKQLALSKLTSTVLLGWMKDYLQPSTPDIS